MATWFYLTWNRATLHVWTWASTTLLFCKHFEILFTADIAYKSMGASFSILIYETHCADQYFQYPENTTQLTCSTYGGDVHHHVGKQSGIVTGVFVLRGWWEKLLRSCETWPAWSLACQEHTVCSSHNRSSRHCSKTIGACIVAAIYRSDWRSIIHSVEGEHPNFPAASRTLGAVFKPHLGCEVACVCWCRTTNHIMAMYIAD